MTLVKSLFSDRVKSNPALESDDMRAALIALGVATALTATIGYGFFIPIFFAYIGINTKLGALPTAGLMSIFFILIAIFGKIIGCGTGARPWFDTRRSLTIGVGMIPRAEVALIMATIGLQAGAIGDEIFVMTILMVFVTNLLTPILLKLSFRWAEKKEAGKCEEEAGTAAA